jgi:uroporphyrinogen decarboxylase
VSDTARFLRACRREPVDVTPVWFMRQAGRYMAEYRALRERYSLLEICRQPDLATEVTLQPIRRLEVDAAILFSDLLLPLEPLGLPFDFVKGEGPQIERPIESPADIDRLRTFEPREALAHVLEAIRQIQRALDGRVPLIGFAGAPFTLASYAIEGGHSNNFARTKALMYGHPEAWHRLCGKLASMVGDYLRAQIEAGVDAVQVFDSWVGALDASDYREFVMPHTRAIFEAIGGSVPTLHFGTGTSMLLELLREASCFIAKLKPASQVST